MGPVLDPAAFEEGRTAYVRGVSVKDIAIKSYADMDRAYEQGADHRAIESASKSFVLGFASGVIEDIRRIAGGSRGGQRA